MRSQNCLQNADIKYIGELVQKTEQEMLKTKNFGQSRSTRSKKFFVRWGLSGHEDRSFPFQEEIENRQRQREGNGISYAPPQVGQKAESNSQSPVGFDAKSHHLFATR